jgi:hypothetical protein
MFYVLTKLRQEKPTLYVVYVKMTKNGTKINLFVTFFVFLKRPQKISVF